MPQGLYRITRPKLRNEPASGAEKLHIDRFFIIDYQQRIVETFCL